MPPLNKQVIDALEDLKAQDLTVLDVIALTSMTDYMIIATGTSTKHTQALARSVLQAVKQKGTQPLSVEGEKSGEWILIDLGDVIVHIMLENIRQFYNLEKLWGLSPNMATLP